MVGALYYAMPEWLRGWPAKPLRNACESSNLSGVVTCNFVSKFFCLFYNSYKGGCKKNFWGSIFIQKKADLSVVEVR